VRYLLDTNIVSALVRDPRGPVTERIRVVGEESICTSMIVVAELTPAVTPRARRLAAAQAGGPPSNSPPSPRCPPGCRQACGAD